MRRDLVHNQLLRRIDEGNRRTLAPIPTRTPNPVDIVLLVLKGRHVEVKHDRHLLDVNPPRQQIGRNQNPRAPAAELAHTLLTNRLIQLSVDDTHRKAALRQRIIQTLRTLPRIREHDRLCDTQRLEDIAEALQLPLIAVGLHIELLDTVQLDLLRTQGDAHGILQNLVGQLLDLRRHGGGEERDLARLRQTDLDDLTHLVGEPVAEHLICLIQHEDAEVAETQIATGCEIKDATRSADHDMRAAPDIPHVLVPRDAADREADIYLHIRTDGTDHGRDLLCELVGRSHHERLGLLEGGVDPAQETDTECAGLAGTGLGLPENIALADKWEDCYGLDCGGLLEAVGINPAEEGIGQPHVIEGGAGRELVAGSLCYKVGSHRTEGWMRGALGQLLFEVGV